MFFDFDAFYDDDDYQYDSEPEDFLESIRRYHLMSILFMGVEEESGRSVNNHFYYKWAEFNMPDSHLLTYSPVAPVYQRTNSINGGHWYVIQSLQEDQVRNNGPGWLQASHVIGHKTIYELAQHIVLLLDAWRLRFRKLNIPWQSEAEQDITRERPGLTWFLKQRSTQEDMTVEERSRHSVERGMVIFRSEEEFDRFYQEMKAAVNIIPNILMKILCDSVPVQLPYTALSLISKYVLDSSDCCTMKPVSQDLPGQLVESRYVGRLYLSLLDIHNSLTELLFRHAGETASPNFPEKFSYLRNIVRKNHNFLETYYELTEENTDHHLMETKDHDVKILPSSVEEIRFLEKFNQNEDRIAFNNKKLFIVNGLTKDGKSGIYMKVINMDSGEVIKEFLAVSLDLLKAKITHLCTSVKVQGNVLLLTTSHGLPGYSADSHDELFLIDWVLEEIISSWIVPHSDHMKEALQYLEAETGRDGECLDYDEDEAENIAKNETLITVVSQDEFYVLHSEVVMPELGDLRELEDWGQLINIWKVSGKKYQLVFSKEDIRVLCFTRNLLIYEELLHGESRNKSFGKEFFNFRDEGKTVHWFNLESQRDCHQQTFCSSSIPLHTSTVRNDGTIQVLQVFEETSNTQCEDRFIMFDLDVKETSQTGRVVNYPKLLQGNELGGNFQLELLSDGRLYFSHQVFGWSNGSLAIPLATRMVVVEEGETEPNIEIWNCRDTRSQITGCYPYTHRDRVCRDGDTVLFVTPLNPLDITLDDTRRDPYDLRVKCVELGRPAGAVMERDLMVAQSYNQIIQEMKRVEEERLRKLREKEEQERKEKEERWEAGRRKERAEYLQYCRANLRELAGRDPVRSGEVSPSVRYRGILVNWKKTFGFITLSIDGETYWNAENVFLHISDLIRPVRNISPGMEIEFQLTRHRHHGRSKVKASEARVTGRFYRRIGS